MDEILERLKRLETLIEEQNLIAKKALNFKEALKYLDFSKSHLYKLTSSNGIPHYKPGGKYLFFDREELEAWLLTNKVSSSDEIDQQAADYLINKGRVKL